MQKVTENTQCPDGFPATLRAKEFFVKSVRKSSNGNLASGFYNSCMPTVALNIVALSVATFNLAIEWLLYIAIGNLNIEEGMAAVRKYHGRDRTDTLVWSLRDVPITLIAFYFCVSSLLAYILQLFSACYFVYSERRRVRAKRDGLPTAVPKLKRHALSLFILTQIVTHVLPTSSILFVIQLLVCCQLYYRLADPVFFVAAYSSCGFTIIAACALFYSQRLNSKRSDKAAVACSRVWQAVHTSLYFLIAILLTIEVLNVILLGIPGTVLFLKTEENISHKTMFDKVHIDNWLESNALVVGTRLKRRTVSSSAIGSTITNGTGYYQYTELVKLSVLLRYNSSVDFRQPCLFGELDFVQFIQTDQENQLNCQIVVITFLDLIRGAIHYSLMYYYRDKTGTCHQGHLNDHVYIPYQVNQTFEAVALFMDVYPVKNAAPSSSVNITGRAPCRLILIKNNTISQKFNYCFSQY